MLHIVPKSEKVPEEESEEDSVASPSLGVPLDMLSLLEERGVEGSVPALLKSSE